jgi:hypothetical protein
MGHDLVTINVPISVCVSARIPSVMRPNLFRLYSIVGGWSKSIALDRPSLSLNVKGLRDRLFYKSLPKLMWYNTWSDWSYGREVWELAPNLIRPEYTDTFLEYYVLYLNRFHDRYKDSNVVQIYRSIESEVRSYVLDYMQGQSVPEWLQLRLPENIATLDVEKTSKDICRGFSNVRNNMH